MAYRHSGLGICSFVLSILAGLLLLLMIVIVAVMEASNPGAMDENSPKAMALGLFVCGSGFLELLALILGCCGLFQEKRNKIFAILGTSLSALTLFGVAVLMIIGLASAPPN